MLNQAIFVGRFIEQPMLSIDTNGDELCITKLSIPRSYKNREGIYDSDIITIKIRKPLAERIIGTCHEGELIGVKGHLESTQPDNKLEVVAEKVTLLSTKGGD